MLWDNDVSFQKFKYGSEPRAVYNLQANATELLKKQPPHRPLHDNMRMTEEEAPSTSPQVAPSPAPMTEKPLTQQHASSAAEHNFGTKDKPLYASEILIMFKTGATAFWRRTPMHLSTTLSNSLLTPNIAFYSDAPDSILHHTVHDSLANVSDALKSSSDFQLYHRIRETAEGNLYLESGSMEGDAYLPGGWRLDKYKFLPLVDHAAKNYPNMKWYVYMEDDNWFCWENLYAFLATFDAENPLVLGSPAARLGEDFSHGGSGFAISAGAMKKTFQAEEDLPRKWEAYAAERCCGDQVLSHVMQEMGVERYKGNDGSGWFGLQSLPDWRIGFGTWNWCSPLLNVHKVHQADLSRLDRFGKKFAKENVGAIQSFLVV